MTPEPRAVRESQFVKALRLIRKRVLKSKPAQWLLNPSTFAHDVFAFRLRLAPYCLNLLKQDRYSNLSEAELLRTRRSDTVFIFGSGYSLNGLSAEEWDHFRQHDTIGFNHFIIQKWIRIDYLIFREPGGPDMDRSRTLWMEVLKRYCQILSENPALAETILVIQRGWRAFNGNRIIGYGLLERKWRIFRYYNKRPYGPQPPTKSFQEGVVHAIGTLSDCINFAALMGWKHIVLVGVDLYDIRYFWHNRAGDFISYPEVIKGEDHEYGSGETIDSLHRTAANGVIPLMGEWHSALKERGINLFVYNPRSLLVPTLPLYSMPEAP